MPKQRKRRKRNFIRPTIPQQSYIESNTPIERLTTHTGIPLRTTRHTLSHQDDFLDLRLIEFKNLPVDLQKSTSNDHTATTLRDRAEFFINEWNCDWDAIEAHITKERVGYENMMWDAKCGDIYNNFSYQKMGLIFLYKTPYKGKLKLFIQNGQHRSISLACLLLQKEIKWQPIPYWLLSIPENVKLHMKVEH